jgi:predicted lipid-binding transport protein (Tim44 family)
MKIAHPNHECRAFAVYPVVAAIVVAVAAAALAGLGARQLRMGQLADWFDCAIVVLSGFILAGLGLLLGKLPGRGILARIGVLGMLICVGVCAWVFHEANFQLTSKSYQALSAAKVPGDLIAELKNAEGAVAQTEQQFVSDLSTRFGQDHIVPYREALVESGWNVHQRVAIVGLAGFCACFSLTAGLMLARR